ncbi:U2 small nuclear ribonucleoprotein auxiliary factor 35 kDa subunit-related protein 1 [Orchesella cincta]|uniref:U2 small nuclear ribonucleoprotein auxiliary factor 35 kDa subunit-related protein 1 n=1 Tax=Orchesella cincta TaxID=48709 RepID=A0A1D2MTA0_ORCCI|nr:U2 small nuclear ribonucleoprotein auxiliary factor 35 kDa subunit-related protein 1 [Orchesella cincta]
MITRLEKAGEKVKTQNKETANCAVKTQEGISAFRECDKEDVACETRENGFDEDDEDSVDSTFFLSHLEWEEREHQADLACAMKKAEEERMAQIEAENQRKIKEEWEMKQEKQRKLKEEKERLEKLAKEKQEAELNEFLSFLSGDIETPPTKYLMPDIVTDDDVEVCHYFSRTAACRFYDRCTKSHPRPTLSTAILIPNFFSHFKLEQSVRDEYDTDLGLEYEDDELHKEFLEFYDDVMPEFRKHGTVIQFKVCRNLEPHLRGNVYIQYESIRESVEAYKKFNGRFYNGKQLSLQFIKIDSWRSAICGHF